MDAAPLVPGPPAPAPPPPGEVHVLYALVADVEGDAALQAEYDGLLAPEERARRDAFSFERGRLEYLVTRALGRTSLSRYAPVPPTAWRFRLGAHGKPAIAAPDHGGLAFNLSNTRGLVACAVAAGGELGVDVEWIDRGSRLIDVADRFFSPIEVAALHALPEAEWGERFFAYWTLKEAYIKARGMGLALPLGKFSFLLDAPGAPGIAFAAGFDDAPEGWWFERFTPSSRHRGAVARRSDLPEAQQRVVLRRVLPLRPDPPG